MIYEYLRNILEVFFLLVVKRFTWNGKLTLVMRINWRSKREEFIMRQPIFALTP
jgi:hypothetical protein